MIITPLQDYVVLKVVEEADTTSFGLVLPTDRDREESNVGKIVALGSQCKLDIKVDDTILFKRNLFEEIVVNKEKYIVGREANVVLLLNA